MMAFGTSGLDVARIRGDFPVLHQMISGKPLVYMDNAATTQKPQSVIDALVSYYSNDNANVHRGVHTLSQRATDLYEEARAKVRVLLNAASDFEESLRLNPRHPQAAAMRRDIKKWRASAKN